MKNAILEIKTNKLWDKIVNPRITIFTPIYNRRETLHRVIKSVERQTLREIEYILINDGSTVQIDDIIDEYMKNASIPIMYIKKSNGGVHTARNLGWKNARGVLSLCIDSDDELMPNACEICWNAWESIFEKEKYWQIKAQCIDDDGNLCSALFPDNINELPLEERYKYFSFAGGERIGCRVSSIMRENLFPEPDGVQCVSENIVWTPLERRYLSWGINDVIRIYHQDGEERLTVVKKMSVQQCKNGLFASMIYLNNPNMYLPTRKRYIRNLLHYLIFGNILKGAGEKDFVKSCKIRINILSMVLYLPCRVVAPIIRIQRCDF